VATDNHVPLSAAANEGTAVVPKMSKTNAVLAERIQTTPEALVVVLESGAVSIPWDQCSARLAHASLAERLRAELSPSGYGIHWPLIDENLAVGPLLRAAA
jgi:hypothetical protein